MNEEASSALNLPGFAGESSTAPPPKQSSGGRARVKPVDRCQLMWQVVDLEHWIEQDHPARAIWALTGKLDLEGFYAPIAAVEGVAGRTPWDPRLLVSLWVYAYSRKIGSAREIARRCTYDPGFQWLCGMKPINYHTISDFRVAHGAALEELFAELLGVLSAEGLVSLERVMHDGTKIKACASGDTFRREERLRAHLKAAQELVQALGPEAGEEPTRQQAAQQRAAREQQQRLEQALEQLEQIRRTKADAKEKAAVRVSTSDPEARVMKQPDGGFAPSYNVQVSTEASHKIIVGVGLSQNSSDYGELVRGVERVEQNCQAKPEQVVVDGGFTSRENIMTMAADGIDLVGCWGEQEQKRAGQLRHQGIAPEFYPESFSYDAAQDAYRCPAGQWLHRSGQQSRPGVVQYQYRAEASVCQSCACKGQCCPRSGGQGRVVNRAVDAPEVRQFREKMQTAQAQQIYRQRAPVAEFPNAWIKEKLGLRQFHLRGLVKATLEALWVCLTYNINQWIRLCWRPTLAGAQS